MPLRSGGGTRLKILEAMAMGRPVISTALGAEGLDIVPGENILLAETAEQFVQLNEVGLVGTVAPLSSKCEPTISTVSSVHRRLIASRFSSKRLTRSR